MTAEWHAQRLVTDHGVVIVRRSMARHRAPKTSLWRRLVDAARDSAPVAQLARRRRGPMETTTHHGGRCAQA